jgi:hypothetical protein
MGFIKSTHGGDTPMNSSLWQSGRDTHVKIVVVSLVASLLVLGVVTSAHMSDGGAATARVQRNDVVVKAGKPVIYTESGRSTIR